MPISKYTQRERHLKRYIKEKLKMLQEEFLIQLTETEIEHMQNLKTELAVDQYAHTLFFNKL